MEFKNFLSENWLVHIAIVVYVCAYIPYIYSIYKNKNNKQKFKNEYYYIIIAAVTLVLVHSAIDKNYEIVLFCAIKLAIIMAVLCARVLYP
jgi:hypothetical protein